MTLTKTKGSRLLRSFLRANELSLRAAAAALGVSKTSIIFWLRGEQRPRERFRDAIGKWTNGAVPASAWETADERAVVERVQPFTPRTAA